MKGKPLELISYLSQQNRDKIFEVKEVNSNRTQSQNAIAWALITLIANELRKSKEEVYYVKRLWTIYVNTSTKRNKTNF